MRGLRRIIILSGLVSIMLLGCDEDGSSPAGPGGDTSDTVTIECMLIDTNGVSSARNLSIVGIRLSNTLSDTSFYHYPLFRREEPQEYPEFVFSDIPPGTYEITPFFLEGYQKYTFYPPSVTVDATDPYVLVEQFFVFPEWENTKYVENELCLITGQITSDTDVVPFDTTVFIEPESGSGGNAVRVYSNNFVAREMPRGTYTITPVHNLFTFEPPSTIVHAEEMGVFTRFTATYTGRAPHTISGRFVETNGNEFSGNVGFYDNTDMGGGPPLFSIYVEESGSFVSPKLPPGVYFVNVSCATVEWRGNYGNSPRGFTVFLGDRDIDLGDINFTYEGSLYYHVSGMVRDADGVGLEDVTITVDGVPGIESYERDRLLAESDSDGDFQFGGYNCFKTREDLTLTVTPEKDGWTFTPSSAEVTHIYREHVPYVNLTVPEFIGTPVSMKP